MKTMPMGLTSTPLISYRDIRTEETDLFEDALGLNSQFSDVIALLHQLDLRPDKKTTLKLIEKIRHEG